MNDDATIPVTDEPTAVETPQMELANLTQAGDVDAQLATLQQKAALAPQFVKLQNTILASQTYAQDWSDHDGTMCLSSAGAERVGRLFDIKYFEVKCDKEEFTDGAGKAYRYIYTGKAVMANRVTVAVGIFGTRDKFLGFKGGEWRALEEINENHIRMAAYHIFLGNAVKSLLGLRGIPKSEWEKIMSRTGADPGAAGKVRRGEGTQGGTTQADSDKQKELAEICIGLANIGWWVEKQNGKWTVTQAEDAQMLDGMELAKAICREISSFEGKKGKVAGKLASELKGKRLEITLTTAQELVEDAKAKGD